MEMRLKDIKTIDLILMMIHHLKRESMGMDKREKKKGENILMMVSYMMEEDGETNRQRSTEITMKLPN